MYTRATIASLALLATGALAGSPGQAVIVNKCSYDVYLHATPSADGGATDVYKTLSSGETWSQTWTSLTNGNGWSLKLCKDQSWANILQYEYTYQNADIIWYDLSAVNGNPWVSDWQVSSASANCSPRQTWYRFDTDDAFGMQDCPAESSVTVTLCSTDGAVGSVESAVSSVAAAITSAWVAPTPSTTTTTPAPVVTTPTTTAVPTTPAFTAPAHTEVAHSEAAHTEAAHTESAAAALATGHALGFENNHFVNAAVVQPTTTAAPTTLITAAAATPVVDEDSNIVTEIVTVVETAIAYETYVPGKRHVHHPNHPHFR